VKEKYEAWQVVIKDGIEPPSRTFETLSDMEFQ